MLQMVMRKMKIVQIMQTQARLPELVVWSCGRAERVGQPQMNAPGFYGSIWHLLRKSPIPPFPPFLSSFSQTRLVRTFGTKRTLVRVPPTSVLSANPAQHLASCSNRRRAAAHASNTYPRSPSKNRSTSHLLRPHGHGPLTPVARRPRGAARPPVAVRPRT